MMKTICFDAEHNLSLRYYPSEIQPVKATVVLFFGGGWSSDNHMQFADFAQLLVKNGYHAVLPEYRVVANFPGNKVRSCVEDAYHAIDYLVDHAQELHIDPARLVYGGGSSGGHLAACCDVMGKYPAAAMLLFNAATIIPEFDAAGIEMLHTFIPTFPGNEELFDEGEKESLAPYTHVNRKLGPQIQFHGLNDQVVPIETAYKWKEKVESFGGTVEMQLYAGKGHGFFNLEPEKTQVAAQMLDFLDRVFAKA